MSFITDNQSDSPTQQGDGSPDESVGALSVAPASEASTLDTDGETRIPDVLPILPLRDQVAFPGTVMPLNVSRAKSKQVLDLALASDHIIGVVAQRSAEIDDPKLDNLYRVGTACHILKMLKLPDGSDTVIVHGIARIGIEDITQDTPYLKAKVQARHDPSPDMDTELEAMVHNVRHAAQRVIELSPHVPEEARVVLDNIETLGGLADFLAANLSLSLVHKQELLETLDVRLRLRKIYAALTGQQEMLELSKKLHEDVRQQMDKSQRDYFLREQLKAIQAELGQTDARTSELEALRSRIDEAGLPEQAAAAADRELERLAAIPQASPEYSMALDYLNWLADLPWSISSDDLLDLDRAERVLNEDHYGLDKIKRRILEFLAVRKLNPDGKGSILCFVGPPGVGKTSLGQSIARAMGRTFIRMSLGGVHDEAEIRGHRRTYIGALPGRIIQNVKKCGANNPVFMLDEVDKIGQDFRGDPSSALLEVLDPQQNDTFTDHYLEIPFDLSNTLFIGTANYLEPIPPALRDRMEVINLSSYTRREKLEIARRYLLPRQVEENGMQPDQVAFDNEAVLFLIDGYTREAGVRELERTIGSICRAQAAQFVREGSVQPRIDIAAVERILGPIKYVSEVASRAALPGVCTALAFTPFGGEILFVEATSMSGSGSLSLTGQLGDVMRESAQTAFALIRTNARKWRIAADKIYERDLHVHVPAGATPKDGPSAGVAMLLAILSIMKGKSIDTRTAVTGEITLRGVVLPVGGIKEKALAAHRAGIRRVILPEQNTKDLVDVPQEVRDEMEFVPVKHIEDAVKVAFTKPNKAARRTASARSRKAAKKKTTRKKRSKKSKQPAGSTSRKRTAQSKRIGKKGKKKANPTARKRTSSRKKKSAPATRTRRRRARG